MLLPVNIVFCHHQFHQFCLQNSKLSSLQYVTQIQVKSYGQYNQCLRPYNLYLMNLQPELRSDHPSRRLIHSSSLSSSSQGTFISHFPLLPQLSSSM